MSSPTTQPTPTLGRATPAPEQSAQNQEPSAPTTDWPSVVSALASTDPRGLSPQELEILNQLITSALIRHRAYSLREAWPDLRQQVLLRLVHAARRGTIRDPAAFPRFVTVVTRNEVASWARAPQHRVPEQLAEDPEALISATATRRQASAPAEVLERALRRLDAEPRALLRALYWDGRTYTELAKELATSPATIKRRRSTALDALSRSLAR